MGISVCAWVTVPTVQANCLKCANQTLAEKPAALGSMITYLGEGGVGELGMCFTV